MKKYFALLLVFLSVFTNAQSQEIEVIEVRGASVKVYETDPSINFSILDAIMPQSVFVAGGYGGFLGFTERGTQTIHTSVYRNGVPVNDAGSGWYDFGHDLVTGEERITFVSGPNSVLYGSGSLSGTVFINDMFEDRFFVRLGEQHTFLTQTYSGDNHGVNLTFFRVNNGSVKTTNDEDDWYENATIRTFHKFDNVTISANFTDYSYDYDDCFTLNWESSNDCVQRGKKFGISARTENTTLGYNSNNAKFYTGIFQTWESKAERLYFDTRRSFDITKNVHAILGITADQEKYVSESKNNYAVYGVFDLGSAFSVGLRTTEDTTVYRLGYSKSDFSVNFGTSYRNPTLYETLGDSFVNENLDLMPEKSIGTEVSYNQWTLFYYEFSQGIDYNFTNNQFTNTGAYKTKGFRYNDTFGNLNVFLGYTDSDMSRVPTYQSRLSYDWNVGRYSARLVYTGMFKRGTDFNGLKIDDISTFDFALATTWRTNYQVILTVKDLLNNKFEVIPEYAAGGRQVLLSITTPF